MILNFHRSRHYLRDCRGVSEAGGVIAEFTIILPLIILVIQAVLSFGLGYREYGVVVDAVRGATRSAAANRTAASPCGIARDTFLKTIKEYGINPAGYSLTFNKYRKSISALGSDEWYIILSAQRSSGGSLTGFIADWTFPHQVQSMFMFEEESQNLNACMTEIS